MRALRTVLLTALVALACALLTPAAAQAARHPGVDVGSATANSQLTAQWKSFGQRPRVGWAAADGTYSTTLPSGLPVFLENDTFFGPVTAQDGLPPDFHFTHNSAVLATHSGAPLATITAGHRGAPQSLVGPTPSTSGELNDHWFWNGDGIVDGGGLQVAEFEQKPTDTAPPFNFEWVATEIATLDPWTFRLEKETPVPTTGGIQWGVQFLREGPWTYVYGVEGAGFDRYVHLARARTGRLTGAWQYWTGATWSTDPGASGRMIDNVGQSYSVTREGNTYVLVTFPSTLSPSVDVATATSPTGPFTNRHTVYTAPETAQGMFVYNIAAHPEISRPGTLVVSYNTNDPDTNNLIAHIDRNRPRFVDLHLTHR